MARSNVFWQLAIASTLLIAACAPTTPSRGGGSLSDDDDVVPPDDDDDDDSTANDPIEVRDDIPCDNSGSPNYVVDYWSISPPAGADIVVRVDTFSLGSSFDPGARALEGAEYPYYDAPEIDQGDNEFECTEAYLIEYCPELRFSAPGGTVAIEVYVADGNACIDDRGDYSMTATQDGEYIEPQVVEDDFHTLYD